MENEKEPKEHPEMKPKSTSAAYWVTGIIALVVIVGIVLFAGGRKNRSVQQSQSANPPGSVSSSNDDQNTKTFNISAKPFEFSMKEIRVKKGDKVKINLTVAQGMHDWVVDEFSARTKIIQTGQSDSVEFVADKTGTYEYYCSVPTHRQQGMVGKLIVE